MRSSLQGIYQYWRRPLSRLWFGAAMAGLFAHAQADSGRIDNKYFDISSVTIGIRDIDAQNNKVIHDLGVREYSLKDWNLQQVQQQKNREALLRSLRILNEDGDGAIISQVINFGSKLWKLIEDNKPVVQATSVSANALPAGTEGNWLALENWQNPRGRIYSVTYKNLYGMEVVNFDYRLLFSPGGSYNGQGQYLSNVSVNPQNLSVAWGYNVEADAKVVNVLNTGSKASPVAGIELLVGWKIKTVLKDMRSSTSFFVKGDGNFIDLNGNN